MSGAPPPGGQWEPPAGQWGHQQPVAAQESNGKAITALVLGICGLIVCPVILSIPALVLGYQARREIDASQGRQSGRGMAVAGIVTGWIGVVLGALGIIGFALLVVLGESSDTESEDGTFTVEPDFSAITFASDAVTALGALL